MLVRTPNAGAAGVVKDLSVHELPRNVWTDARNVRFLGGYAQQFLGHGSAYGDLPVVPYHVVPVNVGAARYWLYAGASKVYATAITGGLPVHTNLTRQTAGVDVDYTGVPNQWTSTVLSGIPILNPGNTVDPPQRWNLDTAQRMVKLDNWPANTYCKSLRAFKNFLVALGVTKGGVYYPYMVKWSSPADPGGVPATWDPADATQDAGEFDCAEGGDPIIDGLQLRDYLMIYKEHSVWRLTYTGGIFVMAAQKVLGMSGALNRNCVVDLDGVHFVLTGSDIVIHDGQQATSVLDDVARQALFQDMDASATDRAFVVQNPFLNEVFVCYASVGNSIPNKALVYNYRNKTVTYRDMPNVHHAAFGSVDDQLSQSWDSDGDPWNADLTLWNGPGFTPATTRVLMASNSQKLYLLDASASFDGVKPTSFLERVGLSYDAPESIKLLKSVRARMTGNVGETVTISVAGMLDPYETPNYTAVMAHVIGQSVKVDCMVTGRYFAIKFSDGTAYLWRLDSYDVELEPMGEF
jgi:hypothetical protein